MENEKLNLQNSKDEELKKNWEEIKDKYNENKLKQNDDNNKDKKEDIQEDYDSKILDFLNKNKSDQQDGKFKHLINWSKIYLYL